MSSFSYEKCVCTILEPIPTEGLSMGADSYIYRTEVCGKEGMAEKVIADLLHFSSLSSEEYITWELCRVYDKKTKAIYHASRTPRWFEAEAALVPFREILKQQGSRLPQALVGKDEKRYHNWVAGEIKRLTGVEVKNYIQKIQIIDQLFLTGGEGIEGLLLLQKEGGYRQVPIMSFHMAVHSKAMAHRMEQQPIRLYKPPLFTFTKCLVEEYIATYYKEIGIMGEIIKRAIKMYPEYFV